MKSEQSRLQQAIIDRFLPRFGNSAELLYVRDSHGNVSFAVENRLLDLGLSTGVAEKLPDIVAYSKSKNWLYLIESAQSANQITEQHKLAFKKLVEACTAYIVYVSAYRTKEAFQQCVSDIAWDTEVWIAEEPDHMVHFKTNTFIEPYALATQLLR